MTRVRCAAAAAGLIASINACGSSTGPSAATHPVGILDHTIQLGTRACGTAVSRSGILYVALIDQQQVAVGNLLRGSLGPTAFSVGVHPCTLQFSESGSSAFVSNQDSPSIGLVDVATGVMTTATAMPASPLIIRLSADGSRLYVTAADGNLYVLDASTGAVAHTVTVSAGSALMGVVADAATSAVYVAGRYTGNVTAIDAASLTVKRTYSGGTSAQNLIVLPDHKRILATDIDGAALRVWDIASGALVSTIPTGNNTGPFDVQLSPDGQQLYVSEAFAGVVQILDARSLATVASVATQGSPRYVVFDASGKQAAITNDGGWVDFIR